MNIFFAIVIIGLLVFLYAEDKWITITDYCYNDRRIPEAFDGIKILHVSDLQSAYFGRNQKSLIRMAEKTNPDIIFFTGDLVDRNRTNLKASMSAIKQLQKIAPVYFVTGNHELAIEDKLDDFYEEMENEGIVILSDDVTRITSGEQSLYIAGVSDETLCQCKLGKRRSDTAINPEPLLKKISLITEKIPGNEFLILLSHEPQFFKQYVNEKIGLVFTGHAHGGQIRLPFTDGLFAPGQGILPKMTSGMRTKNKTTMIISRGLGNSVFPFRLFNRPELVTVVLSRI